MPITDHPSHEDYLLTLQRRAIVAARKFLAQEVSFVISVRELTGLARGLEEVIPEELALEFVFYDSETDHIPVGEVRDRWAPEALERLDHETREIEELHGAQVAESCRSLLAILEGSS